MQTDAIEIHTYENQRWNVLSGLLNVLNIKEGFTDIGKTKRVFLKDLLNNIENCFMQRLSD